MKASGMLLPLLLLASSSASPMPQFTGFPGFPPVGGGGGTGGTGFPPVGGGGGTSSSTANDVTDKAPCTPLTVIFARGTGEPGNIGSVAGPPMLSALKSKLGAGNVAFQGVPYAASAAGNADQGGDGGSLMVSLAQQALQQCPNSKIVLSGYSQGGFVVHVAAQSLKPAGAVIFGDPENGQAVANVPAADLLEICAQGDGVCGTPRTYAITPAHLSYGNNAGQAADFIATLV